MKKALLACEIIKQELLTVIEERNDEIDIVWLGEALHEHPEKLKEEIIKTLGEMKDYDKIALSYGLCGNALIGVKAEYCDIYFPRVDDCIKGLMYYNPELPDLRRCSIFTGCGWLNTKNNTGVEYNRTLEKYGPERAKMIFKMMYANYKDVVYMQSEETVSEENKIKAAQLAERLELELKYKQASLDVYRKLLGFEESDCICRLKKGETIDYNYFYN